METGTVTLPLAFLAGLLSFASPCVLPLVPAYIGYLGGTAVATAGPVQERSALDTFVHALLFVLGFMVVFVLLGASATFVGRLLLNYSLVLQRVGSVLLVVFGLRLMAMDWSRRRFGLLAVLAFVVTALLSSGLLVQGRMALGPQAAVWLEESLMMAVVVLAGAGWGRVPDVLLAVAAGVLNFVSSYDLPVPNLAATLLIAVVVYSLSRTDWFYAEKKLELQHKGGAGYARSALFGVVFAAGWTPCVGPILAGILLIASQFQTVGQGVVLLVVYSLGLGIPFLVVGLAFGPLSRWLRRMNRYLGVVSIVSATLLILMGILLFTDSLGFLAQYGNFFELEL